jgi:diaminopimelate epimerase
MKFTKMQGIGNDYIYVDCTRESVPDPAGTARRLSDRHFGIGSDGLVLILPGEKADFRMRMFNADGSEAEMCGNASRCVARYVYERGLTDRTEITLETGAGIKTLRLKVKDGKAASVQVDMGAPELRPERIPVDPEAMGLPENAERIQGAPLRTESGTYRVTCVSMGNPHCVVFMDGVEDWPIETEGPRFENHPAFPRRTNTEFARVKDRTHIRMRVWERGSGETLACGTGACAAVAAAIAQGRCIKERKVKVQLRGGEMVVCSTQSTIFLQGPAAKIYEGWISL